MNSTGVTSENGRTTTGQAGGDGFAQEVVGTAVTPLRAGAHLLEPIILRDRHEPDQVIAATRSGTNFVDVTAAEFLARVRSLAKGLIGSGVARGDRVAIMSHTRLEWLLVDYAIMAVGATTVPVYETSAAEQVAWILADSDVVLVVVESTEMRALVDETAETAPDRRVVVIDGGGLDGLIEQGSDVDDAAVDARIDALTIDDMATIIYTSGTTGRPKGCALTHANLRNNVLQCLDSLGEMIGPDERSLLFLPLAHVFAKTIALVGVEHGIKSVFASDMANLAEELPMAEPTMVVGVPRVFEKVFSAAQQRASSGVRGRLFARASTVAIRFAKQRAADRPSPLTRVEHAIYERLVYRPIRAAFGGSLRFAFSGGSPLGERLTYFFDGAGVRILEGYGLTETSPILTVNRIDAWMPGTVGPPLAGTSLRIAPDGEILARGPQVFGGYWRDEAATKEVFTDDGWFRTGDLGRLDDGFLRIIGRKKELIITAGGKNVAPALMEDQLRAHPLISQAMLIGDNRPFVSALVTLDDEALEDWRTSRTERGHANDDPGSDPEIRRVVQKAVDEANSHVSRAESIRAFAVLPADFTVEAGELTPTMKVRRSSVEDRYARTIASLYSAPETAP